MDDSEMARSSVISDSTNNDTIDDKSAATMNVKNESVPGYSHIEDSYFNHAATQDLPPVQAKALDTYKNTIQENFFGTHITVTKLLNKDTNKE